MAKNWSLIIEVTNGNISAQTGGGGGNKSGKLDPGINGTRRSLVNMFEKWLRTSKINECDQVELELLGTLLYEMIFPADIGEQFITSLTTFQRELKADPPPKQKRLRVELKIKQEDIAGLPWEFLFCPNGEGRPGFFLSERTDLMLSRYIPLTDERSELAACPKIKVLVVEMPVQFGNPLGDVFEKLNKAVAKDKSRGGDRRLAELEVRRITKPTGEDLEEQLGEFQPDVVHYIGPGNNKENTICLMETEGEGNQKDRKIRWLSDGAFGSLFQVHQPQLLFLHLWQSPDSLQSSFAGLAPALIGRKIKAIVALRYPFTPTIAEKFTEKVYDKLLSCETVADAVQEGRRTLWNAGKFSSFGSPVLFMQSIDGPIAVLPAQPRTTPSERGTRQFAPMNAPGGAMPQDVGAINTARTSPPPPAPEPVANDSLSTPGTRGAATGSSNADDSRRKEAAAPSGEDVAQNRDRLNPLDARTQQLQQSETGTSGN